LTAIEKSQIAPDTQNISVQDIFCKIGKGLNVHLRMIITQDKTYSAV
jgi:hypothetical protein